MGLYVFKKNLMQIVGQQKSCQKIHLKNVLPFQLTMAILAKPYAKFCKNFPWTIWISIFYSIFYCSIKHYNFWVKEQDFLFVTFKRSTVWRVLQRSSFKKFSESMSNLDWGRTLFILRGKYVLVKSCVSAFFDGQSFSLDLLIISTRQNISFGHV